MASMRSCPVLRSCWRWAFRFDVPEVVVIILVLSVFITAPSGIPKSLKRCKK